MSRHILKYFRFLFFALSILIPDKLHAQKKDSLPVQNYFIYDFGGGTSSFSGYSFFSSFSAERKSHKVTVRWNLNNQIGNREPYILGYKRYNDRLRFISVLYGLTYRTGPVVLSASLGVGYCKYQDKYLFPASQGFLSPPNIGRNINYGMSIDLQSNVLICLNENFGMGLVLFGNANEFNNVIGAAFVLTCGILKSE